MDLMRRMLLRAGTSNFLQNRLTRMAFVRRAVRRFMPGEDLADALDAAARLKEAGFPAILTRLGENVKSLEEAEAVIRYYQSALDEIAARQLDVQISIKPTQLGFDQDRSYCLAGLEQLARHADGHGNYVWIDMESSVYLEGTLDLYRQARQRHRNIGLCLQAYLHRTPADLQNLLPLAPGIRLVKGAYLEPPSMALADKSRVDRQYSVLAGTLLREAAAWGVPAGIATHDPAMLDAAIDEAQRSGLHASRFEFQLLYGIRRDQQIRLQKNGFQVRILISYGSYWFPWYMRRLAERPANVWFVLKSMFR